MNQMVVIGTTTAANLGSNSGSTTPLIVSNGGLCVGNGGSTCAKALQAGGIYAISVVGGTVTVGAADLAEKYPTNDSSIEPGDLVMFDKSNPVYVSKYESASTSVLMGVISTEPGMTLGESEGSASSTDKHVIVALAGRIPTKVNLEAGPISVGDRITPSSVVGVGMKATKSSEPTVGIALESFNGASSANSSSTSTSISYSQSGKILVFVNLAGGKMSGVADGTIESGWIVDQKTGAMKMASSTVLDMQGKDIINVGKLLAASGKWSLDENGKLSVQSLTVGSATNPTGVTLFDRTNGTPYCFYIEGGLSKTVSGECSGTVNVGATQNSTPSSVDNVPPVIKLNGNNPAQLNKGDTYSDMGATVTDNIDTNLGVVTSGDTVDTSKDATYTIKYNATDNAGNKAVEVLRTVVVGSGGSSSTPLTEAASSTPPVTQTSPDTAMSPVTSTSSPTDSTTGTTTQQ